MLQKIYKNIYYLSCISESFFGLINLALELIYGLVNANNYDENRF